jgi:hypothetical protein
LRAKGKPVGGAFDNEQFAAMHGNFVKALAQ